MSQAETAPALLGIDAAPLSRMKDSPLPIADPDLIGPYTTLSDLARKLKTWTGEHLRNLVVLNAATRRQIIISHSHIKHTISRSKPLQRERLLALLVLPELLINAVHQGSEPDKDGRKEVLAVHHFLGEMQLEGSAYRVWLLVRETREGAFFYDHAAAVLA